jgi:calcineurin-like phosphoesterase family protein
MDFQVEDDELVEPLKFHISHYPCEFWTRGAIHLHGHMHSRKNNTNNEVLDYKPMRYDIGVDNWEYKPVSYNEIKHLMLKL